MENETQAAESSTAVLEAPIEIPRSNTPEYDEWRKTGEVKKAVKADSATAVDPDEAADSAAKEQEKQSKRRPDVEERFKQLTDKHTKEMETLRRELDDLRKPKDAKAESSPAKPPQTYAEWRKDFKATKWIEDYAKANPDASYEESSAAMADHLGDVREQFRDHENREKAQTQALKDKLDEARKRYPNADEAIFSTSKTISESAVIPLVVKAMINDSDVFPDLLYTLGNDAAKFAEFVEMAKNTPGKALRYIALVENGVIEALAKGKSEARNEKGQFVKEDEPEPVKTPAKREPAAPPIEVGSRGSGTADDAERAVKSVESGNTKDFRKWMEAENAKELRRRNGA